MEEQKKAELSFEAIMERLAKTVMELEKGEFSLEASMKAYEEGVLYVRLAEDKLKNMEARMEQLISDGSVKELKVEVSN